MSITAPLRIPQLSDIAAGNKAKFDEDVDYYINWQANVLVPGLEEFVGQLNNFATNGSSTSPMTIELGNKSLTADIDKGFLPGMTLRLAARSNPSVWMQGDLQTYSPTTGAFTIKINKIQGDGTFSDWVISPAIAGESLGMGAAVASSATPNIWRDDGNKREITGTTTITGFALAPYAGALQWLRFADAVTITASSDLILGIPSYTTQAGDWAMVLAETTTRFRVIIVRKDGKALNTGVLAADIPSSTINLQHLAPSAARKVKSFGNRGLCDYGYLNMLVQLEDDSLLGWGRLDNFVLGIGSNPSVATGQPMRPAFQPPLPAGVKVSKFAFSGGASFAVMTDGSVYSCGMGNYGMLGHGNTTSRNIFRRIEYFEANGIDIVNVWCDSSRIQPAAGTVFFIDAAGVGYSGGYNGVGQAGVGDNVNKNTPVQISTITGIKEVTPPSCYYGHSFLLTNAGVGYGAGYNGNGQLGVGDTVNKTSFVTIPGFGSNPIKKIRSTSGFIDGNGTNYAGSSILLTESGEVYTSGYNGYGQCGHGDTVARNTFIKVAALNGIEIVDVGMGGGYYGYSWAVSAAGQLYMWGCNGNAILGDGTTTSRLTPFAVNSYQTVLDGVATTVASPPPFVGQIVKVEHSNVGLGWASFFVLDSTGRIWMTGYERSGLVGLADGNKTRFTQLLASQLSSPDEKFVDIIVGGYDDDVPVYALSNHKLLYGAGRNLYAAALANGPQLLDHVPSMQRVYL